MHYIIDAYNLLFRRLKKSGSLEKTRQKLIEELNEVVANLHLKVTLVFDGAEKHLPYATRGHFVALEIVYTSENQTADEYITEEVNLAKRPSQITVVTNDRELAKRCHLHNAQILTIDQFIAFLAKKKAKKRAAARTPRTFKESDPEIARLLAIFEKRFGNLSEN